MRVLVVDSGVGNVANAVRGLARVGAEVVLTDDPDAVTSARALVLPGVGAFSAAMERLRRLGLDRAIAEAVDRGAAVLGICLGHQLLFERSSEFGSTVGLGLLSGRVEALPRGVRTPHVGWSRVRARGGEELFTGLGPEPWFYFVHSYAAAAAGDCVATVEVGGHAACAAARRGRVFGVQFHPEKSGAAGRRLLRNFLDLAA